MTALMESTKRKMGGDKDQTSQDGGQYPSVYEVGSTLELTPIERDPTLVGYWSFEEGSGNATSTDYSGNNNNGTWYGTSTHYGTGKVGTWAGSFNGSSDYVSVANSSSFAFGTGSFSISAWINPDSVAGYRMIFVKGFYLTTNNVYLDMYLNSGGIIDYPAGTVVVDKWQLATAVIDHEAQVIKFYLDGGLVGTSGDISDIGSLTNSNSVILGRFGTSDLYYFDGPIDDVRVYNRALSAAEIQAIYNATR